jgi:N-acetylmuramoyl-L-alanine amidase
MPIKVIAEPGDCIDSIAFKHGFFPDKIWNHGDNAELKRKRKDPNVLHGGDEVVIPEKEEGPVSKPDAKRYKFKRKGVPAKFKIQIKQNGKPVKNEPYTLDIDGKLITGKTDANGKIETSIPPDAKVAKLQVGEGSDKFVYDDIKLGGMDPADTAAGARARLTNLGYPTKSDPPGEIGDETKEALKQFQNHNKLDATGGLDKATQDKLKELFGC